MRENEFKAWDKNRKEYRDDIYLGMGGELYQFSKQTGYGTAIAYANNETLALMQWTGLWDINGKKIYEGDIVEYKDYSNGGVILGGDQPKSKGVVEINNLGRGIEYLRGIGRFETNGVEVIGNIYENPELIKWTFQVLDKFYIMRRKGW